jgi:hypothetical protein
MLSKAHTVQKARNLFACKITERKYIIPCFYCQEKVCFENAANKEGRHDNFLFLREKIIKRSFSNQAGSAKFRFFKKFKNARFGLRYSFSETIKA